MMQCRRTVFWILAILSLLTILLAVFFVIVRQHLDGCTAGSFSCGNKSQICVAQKAICNGHPDCPGGEDEPPLIQCHDFHGSSFILNTNFWSRRRIVPPAYHICNISFGDDRCTCKNGTRLYCPQLGLTSVPSGISRNVTRLVLNDNTIDKISIESFSDYPDLDMIHLEGNLINDIPPGCFKNQKNLKILFLNKNRLKHLGAGAFLSLSKLRFLSLDNNLIESIDMTKWTHLESLNWLSIINNSLSLKGFNSFPHMPSLNQLELDFNSIERIEENTFKRLNRLTYLSLSKNRIEHIHPKAFVNLILLEELDLSSNHLKMLHEDIFQPTSQLDKLYLGHNPFVFVPSHIFTPLVNLTSLDLQEINIENIDIKMFSLLMKLDFIYFKYFQYCSFAPNVPKCKPNTDGISSSEHLLSRPMLRIAVWVVAATTACGNALVIWGRIKSHDENKVLSFIIRNLAVSDGLMAIYLATIGIQDALTRGIYHKEAYKWMASKLCTLIGALALISSEVSIFILIFMTVERFLIIANPFGGHTNSLPLKHALAALIIIWITGITLGILPIINWKDSTRFYGTNAMCFPLHISEPFLLGWEYSAFLFFGINFTGLLVLASLYTGMFISISRTRHATSLSSIRDIELTIRFFFIVLTDALCWLPIILLKAAALTGYHIPGDLYAWMVVFVLPVNSALNPLLYTFTTPKYKTKLWKRRFWCRNSGTQDLIPPREINSLNETDSYRFTTKNIAQAKLPLQFLNSTAFPA